VDSFHVYGLNWTEEAITWFIDGTAVRTLEYADALEGSNFPQTPCRVNIGTWAGGASTSEGTVTWAGGETDFDNAPFTMYVESVNITSYNPTVNYNWTDTSGSYSSIELLGETVASNSSSSESSSGTGLGSNATTSTTSSENSTTSESAASSGTSLLQSSAADSNKGLGNTWLVGVVSLFLCISFACNIW
jgi:beta-glucanase (GH16 family)